jgi:hypothetical protein
VVVCVLDTLVVGFPRDTPTHALGVQNKRSMCGNIINKLAALTAAFAPPAEKEDHAVAEQRGRVAIAPRGNFAVHTRPRPDHALCVQLANVVVVFRHSGVLFETAAPDCEQSPIRRQSESVTVTRSRAEASRTRLRPHKRVCVKNPYIVEHILTVPSTLNDNFSSDNFRRMEESA